MHQEINEDTVLINEESHEVDFGMDFDTFVHYMMQINVGFVEDKGITADMTHSMEGWMNMWLEYIECLNHGLPVEHVEQEPPEPEKDEEICLCFDNPTKSIYFKLGEDCDFDNIITFTSSVIQVTNIVNLIIAKISAYSSIGETAKRDRLIKILREFVDQDSIVKPSEVMLSDREH